MPVLWAVYAYLTADLGHRANPNPRPSVLGVSDHIRAYIKTRTAPKK